MRNEGYCSWVVCQNLTSLISNRAINEHAQWHVKKSKYLCLKRLRSRVMPRNTSEKANIMLKTGLLVISFLRLTTQRSARGYPTIVNDTQPYPKRCLLMPLARVAARSDSTTLTAYEEGLLHHLFWTRWCFLRRHMSNAVQGEQH